MGKRDFFKQPRFAQHRFQARRKAPEHADKAYESSKKVETFAPKQGREALVQCWSCNRIMIVDADRGELRLACRSCGGKVEILTIDGVNQ